MIFLAILNTVVCFYLAAYLVHRVAAAPCTTVPLWAEFPTMTLIAVTFTCWVLWVWFMATGVVV